MLIARDILDNQMLDVEGEALGRVDALVAELPDNAPPRVVEAHSGFVPLARRLGPRLERWVTALHKRWSVRRSAHAIIPWSSVKEVHMHHLTIDVRAEETATYDWERWLRRHFIEKIPGSGKDEE